MKLPRIFIIVLTMVLALPGASFAGSLAVFPLLDLSQDESGVNLALTGYLREKAAEKGFAVLPEEELMAFLVKHRIRNMGVLTSYQLTRLREELNAEYALLGTVCQLGEQPAAKLSLSLQLVRTGDEAVIWSVIRDLHEDDLISLLAINDPDSLQDLFDSYFSTLFDDLPPEISESDETAPSAGILTAKLQPVFVKPGEKMETEIRIYSTAVGAGAPSYHLLLAGNEHPLDQDPGARLLRATWLAPEQSGVYPVDLVAVFPEGERQIQRVGEYTVDGTAPELTIRFIGRTFDDAVYFNHELAIVPLLTIPEVLSRWEIRVYDKDRQLVLLQDGNGQIPERLYWNGMLSGTQEAPDGKYLVHAQVWDRAENLGSAEGYVNVIRSKPQPKLTLERQENDVLVHLENEVDSPLAFWFVKVYEKNGGLLLSQLGETLPVTLELSLQSSDAEDPLEMIFAAQDRYGNQTWQKIDNLLNLGIKQVETEVVPESDWLENF
ncbi:MAG: hypothetical protein ACYCYR_04815 [Desulfobulbaceae bacterium]